MVKYRNTLKAKFDRVNNHANMLEKLKKIMEMPDELILDNIFTAWFDIEEISMESMSRNESKTDLMNTIHGLTV